MKLARPAVLRLDAGPLAGCLLGLFVVQGGGCYEPVVDEGAGDTGSSNSSGDGDGNGDGDGDGSASGDGDGDMPPLAPEGYYVKGNKIYASDGQVHVFRGIDRPSLEWSPNGEGISQADIDLIASWNANVIRVAINQGFWLEGSVVYNSGYRQRIDDVVAWSKAAGMDVVLDLHWSDKGDLSQVPAQQRMADENSRAFWQSVAERYKDDGRVIFELYNEPHDVAWFVWLNGGDSGDGFEAVGMQALYDTVRDAGADNLVLIGGLNYAYDLSGVPNHRVEGYNIVYTSHPYDFGNKQPGTWDADWGFLAETDPIFVTEFGSFDCNPSYSQQLIDYAEQRGLSWSAWAWFPGGCGFPALIEDLSGTPSATGQIVKTALGAN
ncbi:glycoside hydrolase family 5 protein [Enhygromyxa salina]|uniref:Endoglucanase n=1 Tax=Enhygromyxa salina TaxID=215803 RepID=A0A2S9Y0F5_9BACT|nr:glycoside hydrolase family 5 protein [Enhygromyxa salina]PRP98576.1 Endoglucanase precursor [Enhygromyxa salina]